MLKQSILLCCAMTSAGMILAACVTHQTVATPADRTVITSVDQLPRHSYPVQGDVRELLEPSRAGDDLLKALQRDILADLAAYDIRDAATLQTCYRSLAAMAFLQNKPALVRQYISRIRELEDKPGLKLTGGIITLALLDSLENGVPQPAVFEKRLRETVAALPFLVVSSQLKEGKSTSEIFSRNLVYGIVDTTIAPAAKSGGISADLAMKLLSYRWALTYYLPVKEIVSRVYGDAIARNTETSEDIWTARMVDFSGRSDLTPVIVAVWDSGVDVSLFSDRLWTNTGEIAGNGIDDDGNGYIDDIHGIGFDLLARYQPTLLMDMPVAPRELDRARENLRGYSDMQADIASPQAAVLKEHLAAIAPDQVKAFLEDLQRYAIYAHGTHVAGIALKNNPAARLLSARLSFDYRLQPAVPTLQQARNDAAAMAATVDYFKAAGVRVVNISWGESPGFIEQALEINNAGGDAEARKKLARKILDVLRNGLYAAMQNAPDILFVVSAGNSDNDAAFDAMIPSSFRLPNMLTVGAVNQAGDETGFTSFGPVDLYANGSEVASVVPGGEEMKLSGTSASSPAVTNLAAKLLALRPGLCVARVRKLILDGCDTVMVDKHKTLRLLNPRASIELVAQTP